MFAEVRRSRPAGGASAGAQAAIVDCTVPPRMNPVSALDLAHAADNGSEFLQSAGDLPFDTVGGRAVVVDIRYSIGWILLCDNTVRVIMGISIALRVTELGRTGVMAIA